MVVPIFPLFVLRSQSQLELGQTKTIMVMPIFPLLTSSKKGGQVKQEKQGVCSHHHLGNGGKTIGDTLSIWYGNDIGHPSHSKTRNSRNTQVE